MDYRSQRQLIRGDLWDEWGSLELDQKLGLPMPPLEKSYPKDATLIDLVSPKDFTIGNMPLSEAIRLRQSSRKYLPKPLSLEELSFLLWATQGVKSIIMDGYATRRTVPSGGARHPFETYLAVMKVEDLAQGLYRYLAIEHKLLLLSEDPEVGIKISEACADFALESAVTFIWTAIPYRSEWRYGPLAAKLIAQDSGHVCQNLYLACTAIQAGTCAVGAYIQQKMDALLGVDGVDEFTVYCGPVGKI
ncbi:MAG: nitroreductase [Anaerolineales bacterium]|nr:SagB/ThcOx family dehydrogenase [Anaerolineae bacterium]PWB54068.1 MAG: nitroreductase [Anaerolineales bacterium]